MTHIVVEVLASGVLEAETVRKLEVELFAIGLPGAKGDPGDTAAANAYTDAQIAAEQVARTAGDAALLAAVDAVADDVATRTTASAVGDLIAAAVGTVTQGYSAVLAGLAALNPTAFGKSLLELASAAALRTAIALPTTSTVGRLARYTDTAGGLGQTTGLYEDAAAVTIMDGAAARIVMTYAPGAGVGNLNVNMPATAPAGSSAFAATFAAQTGVTQNGFKMQGNTNWSMVAQIINSSTSNNSGAAWEAYGYGTPMLYNRYTNNTSGQHWSIGSNNADNFVICTAANTASGAVLTIDKTAKQVSFANPPKIPAYTVGTVPSAATYGAGSQIYVSNESGGAVVAFSDGTNWRRVTDRAIIS